MFLGYLKRNIYAAFLFYLLTLFLLWIPHILFHGNAADDIVVSQMPFQASLLNFLQLDGTSEKWLVFVFTYLNACLLWLLNVRHIFIKASEHLLPLCYILFASAVPETQLVFGAQIAVSLLILGIHYAFSAYLQKPGLTSIFMTAFCFALASLFFSPAVTLLALVPIIILVLHPFAWRDWIVMIAGMAIPYFYVFLYYFLTTADITQVILIAEEHFFHTHLAVTMPNVSRLVYLLFFLILLIVALLSRFSHIAVTKAKNSYCYTISVWMLLLLLTGAIFYPANNYLALPLVAVPAAMIVTNYFSILHWKKTRITLFLLYITAVLIVQLF